MLPHTGATERMNLCQALTSAMDITMEKDSAAGETAFILYSKILSYLLIEFTCKCLIK